jgi:flagellar motor switch protein FliN
MADRAAQLSRESADRLAASLTTVLAGCTAGARVTACEFLPEKHVIPSAGPASVLSFTLGKGGGAAALVLPGALGPDLSRLLLGESPTGLCGIATPEETDALQELANQVAGALTPPLGALLGKPIGFEAPRGVWVGADTPVPAWGDAVAVRLEIAAPGLCGEAMLLLPRAILGGPASAETPLPPLGEASPRRSGNGMDFLLDVMLPITVELGRTRMPIREVLHLAPGSILELDKLAGEPVDIRVNDKSIARGEVVVIDENFGVRLTSIVAPPERVDSFR